MSDNLSDAAESRPQLASWNVSEAASTEQVDRRSSVPPPASGHASETKSMSEPNGTPAEHHGHQSFWLWVLCLTGVDYFSTLAYQPSIAFEATGRLAPFATILLVALTLFGALPVYRYVCGQSFHGQGSIAMLEKLVRGWTGKLLVLVLLGFAMTDFVITKTLSAADAAEHLIHNPFWKNAPAWMHNQMLMTMGLLVLLGGLFLRGFREVIGIAVILVGTYLTLNAIILLSGFWHLASHPEAISAWWHAVRAGHWQLQHVPVQGSGIGAMLLVCLLYFPKLALGLSGFETGIVVMPLIRGDATDTTAMPAGRIRNTRKLLTTAACVMSMYLIGSAVIVTMLIPAEALQAGGDAANRALAYVAHGETPRPINPLFGELFGTLYDLSTVTILWFAGASAMSGLLNLVPRYLPRYGMAPEWAAHYRSLVLLFTVINLLVTWVFKADVSAQGGAYATGVTVLICSDCIATIIDKFRKRSGRFQQRVAWPFVAVAGIFLYVMTMIVIEKPEGLMIASCFIGVVLVSSLTSRMIRSTELRFVSFRFVDHQSHFLWDALRHLEFPVLVPHRSGGARSLADKEEQIRREHHLDASVPIVFVEATLGDVSEFYHSPVIEVTEEEGRFIIRVTKCASIAHTLASIALELSKCGRPPELHFGWSDENPLAMNLKFVLFGEGNVPWMVRELIQKAEPDPAKQPRVIIG